LLYIFGGLPGTGKSTLAQRLAADVGAAYLRVDTIEQAIRDEVGQLRGPEGYMVAYRLATDNLRLGLSVVADTVNPIPLTRAAWRTAAAAAGAPCVEIHVSCSDPVAHRRRVEGRPASVPGLAQPTWADVLAREFAPWPEAGVTIDTAGRTPAQSTADLFAALG